jgi:thiol-disulfide isomerase/thioredoxin
MAWSFEFLTSGVLSFEFMQYRLSSLPFANLPFAILLFAICLFTSGPVTAQPSNGSSSNNNATLASAAELYADAKSYAEKKFEEFARKNVPYSEKLEERTYREQRELAARNADQIALRKEIKGEDLFYLGLLYNLADNGNKALDALKKFLSENASGPNPNAQTARMFVVEILSDRGAPEEAEKFLADYKQNQPIQQDQIFRIESKLTSAYYNSKRYEQAARRARAALEALKIWKPENIEDKDIRNEALSMASLLLAKINQEMNKKDDAASVLNEARSLAFAIPSASLYESATRALIRLKGPSSDIINIVENRSDETAPELNIKHWLDKKTRLSDLRGRVVLLDFWASWCGPCIQAFPHLREMHDKYKKKGLTIIGVTKLYGEYGGMELTPGQELAHLRGFKQQFRLPYAIAVHDTRENHAAYGVDSFPTVFLLDKRGRVRYIGIGANANREFEIEQMIVKLLNE